MIWWIQFNLALFGRVHFKWRILQFLSTTGSTNQGPRLWQVHFQIAKPLLKTFIFRIVFELVKDEQVSPADGDRTNCQQRRCTHLDSGRLLHHQHNHQVHHQHVNMMMISKKSLSAATLHGSPRCLEDGETLLWPDTRSVKMIVDTFN